MIGRFLVLLLVLAGGSVSCTVYDDAALTREPASEDPRVGTGAATRSGVDGCDGADCENRSSRSLDSGLSEINNNVRAAAIDAAPRGEGASGERSVDANTGENANAKAAAAPDSGKSIPAEADAGRTMAGDGGEPGEVESGVGETKNDAGVENGFCVGCDNAPSAIPVLSDTGGMGNVTTFGSVVSPSPSAGGACNYGSTAITHFAAINVDVMAGDAAGQWQGGRICGQCLAVRVKTEEGWKETVVRVVDKCTDQFCGIALSGAAAQDLMGDRPGRYAGNWRFVSCDDHSNVSDGAAALRVKDGSSMYWSLVHVRNPSQAVTAIDWQSVGSSGSGTFSYATEAENFFSVPEAALGSGMLHLTVHYRDKANAELDVAASQLATPGAEIALP